MYEKYSRQSLPGKEYRELLGSAVCVFNSNNSFIIENILKNDTESIYAWHKLIDEMSGRLLEPMRKTISIVSDDAIADKFDRLIETRNRIIHSFQITNKDGSQKLATKDKNHKQWVISKKYLLNFIKENEELSDMLHKFRGY